MQYLCDRTVRVIAYNGHHGRILYYICVRSIKVVYCTGIVHIYSIFYWIPMISVFRFQQVVILVFFTWTGCNTSLIVETVLFDRIWMAYFSHLWSLFHQTSNKSVVICWLIFCDKTYGQWMSMVVLKCKIFVFQMFSFAYLTWSIANVSTVQSYYISVYCKNT